MSVGYWRETNVTADRYTAAVNVTDDPTGEFRTLLVRGPVTCRLNDMAFPAAVTNGGERIACETVRNRSEDRSRASASSTVYFSVDVDGVPLQFDDVRDHYVNGARYAGCDGRRRQNGANVTAAAAAECVNCFWDDDDGYRYYCRWCPRDRMCAGPYEQCDVRRLNDTGRPVAVKNVVVQCPEVRIVAFEPEYGPWTGGTTVRINVTGSRGTLSENKLPVVTVAGSRCLLPTVSKDGASITCTITTINNSSALNEGPVEVMYASETDASTPSLTIRSDQSFYFVDPEVDDVRPRCGPATGGTQLHVVGNYLKAGNNLKVYVGENVTCAVTEHTQNRVTCTTGASGAPTAGRVRLVFDNDLSKYAPGAPFEYAGEPAVDGNQTFAGIASGGTRIPVRGRYLACVQNPLIHVSYNGVPHMAGCRVHNDTYMVCTSPRIGRTVLPRSVVTLRFGFQANYDDANHELRLPAGSPGYRLYPDPVYTDFETADDGRTVTINGLRLDEGYSAADDLFIRLQDVAVPCNVTAVTPWRVVCRTALRLSDGGKPANGIVVTVGNLVYDVKRKLARRTGPTFFTWFLIAVTVVSLIVTCAVAVVYCFKIALMASSQQNEMQSLCEHHADNNNSSATLADAKDGETRDKD